MRKALFRFLRRWCYPRYALAHVLGVLERFRFGMIVVGERNIPKHGGFILAPNHEGAGDPFAIASCVPQTVRWMAVNSLTTGKWQARFFLRKNFGRKSVHLLAGLSAWLIRGCDVIPVKTPLDKFRGFNGMQTRRARGELDAGGVVGIFPQGGITTDQNTDPKEGVGALARAGYPVIPVNICREEQRITFGRPIFFSRRDFNDKVSKEILQEIYNLSPAYRNNPSK